MGGGGRTGGGGSQIGCLWCLQDRGIGFRETLLVGERLARHLAGIDIDIGLAHDLSAHHVEHRLHLFVDMSLAAVFVFILQLIFGAPVATGQLQDARTVLGAVDGTPVASVEIGVVDTVHGLSLVGEGEVYIVALAAHHTHLQVVENLVHLLRNPHQQQMVLTVVVFIVGIVGILQRVHQRQRPIVVAQGIVGLARFLGTQGRLHHVDSLVLTLQEDEVQLRLLHIAAHDGIGLVLDGQSLGIGQRTLRIGLDATLDRRHLAALSSGGHLTFLLREVAAHMRHNLAHQVGQGIAVGLGNGAAMTFSPEILTTLLDRLPRLCLAAHRQQ